MLRHQRPPSRPGATRAKRARLPGPLTQSGEGLQYLDCVGGGELGAVVTTYPDGSFWS
jgi:hypothetical protein